MRAVVIFESMFGNTETIARSIASGLSSTMTVDVEEVGAAPTSIPVDVDLVVVGGPTHAFGMSRRRTREDAGRRDSDVVSRGNGIREWASSLPNGHAGLVGATFDTKVLKPRLPGSAARGAEKLLRRHGIETTVHPESFFVTDMKGPLVEGETERARKWGEQLGRKVSARSRTGTS
jgi:hypothetical protein